MLHVLSVFLPQIAHIEFDQYSILYERIQGLGQLWQPTGSARVVRKFHEKIEVTSSKIYLLMIRKPHLISIALICNLLKSMHQKDTAKLNILVPGSST